MSVYSKQDLYGSYQENTARSVRGIHEKTREKDQDYLRKYI